jgi:hypothetical protein
VAAGVQPKPIFQDSETGQSPRGKNLFTKDPCTEFWIELSDYDSWIHFAPGNRCVGIEDEFRLTIGHFKHGSTISDPAGGIVRLGALIVELNRKTGYLYGNVLVGYPNLVYRKDY